eukprot:1160913-Pelagomonas_calceolata.AAC.5
MLLSQRKKTKGEASEDMVNIGLTSEEASDFCLSVCQPEGAQGGVTASTHIRGMREWPEECLALGPEG